MTGVRPKHRARTIGARDLSLGDSVSGAPEVLRSA
jgi:hypothetical protein